MRDRIVIFLTLSVSLTFLTLLALHGPIPQAPGYHNFSDGRTLLGIPNGLNTLSNLPFILVGIFGLLDMRNLSAERYLPDFKHAYAFLFLGAILVGFGSAWYHLAPDNATLIWDRLPMTLAFMSLFSIVVAEFVSEKLGIRMFWPLVVLGAMSVIYWAMTEAVQQGDLRPYAVIQFLPMLIIPLILLFREGLFSPVRGYWYLGLCYFLAKIAEHLDVELHDLLLVISGHSLKHLLSALGLFVLAVAYRQRRRALRIG